jgi:uncharacterized protein YjdB
MKTHSQLLIGFTLAILQSCIGTDFMDDPIIGESIVLSRKTLALMPNETAMVTATYYNQYGLLEEVPISWTSSNSAISEVNNVGLITAKAPGQVVIQPSYKNVFGPQLQLTVLNDPAVVATVTISAANQTQLTTGQTVQLNVSVKNYNDVELTGKTIEWFSENSAIVSITPTGIVKAIGNGLAGIHAKVDDVRSNTILFTVAGSARTAAFVAAGGYRTSGTARLELVNNELKLTLSDNFDTDFALGTYVYLANSTNGGTVRASGFEVARIFNDGGATFNISQLNPAIKLTDYRYVIILCKPASVTFGFADLN